MIIGGPSRKEKRDGTVVKMHFLKVTIKSCFIFQGTLHLSIPKNSLVCKTKVLLSSSADASHSRNVYAETKNPLGGPLIKRSKPLKSNV